MGKDSNLEIKYLMDFLLMYYANCIKYAKVQAFSDLYFPIYGQNPILILQ